MNGSENQNLTDEQVLQMIEDAVKSDDAVPEEVTALDKGNKDSEGKAAHAFAEQKRKMKALALELQRRNAKEAETKENSQVEQQSNFAPNAGGNAVATLMGQLNMQAMQNLGLNVGSTASLEAKELIRMERDRLYAEHMGALQRANAIREQAPKMIDDALAGYQMLGPEGVEAVKRRLQKYDVLAQVDPNVIRQTVTNYFGELTLAGAGDDGSDGTNASAAQSQQRRDRASVVAASTVRNGRPGVRPASRDKEDEKPATPDESRLMAQLGTSNLKLFREAQARRHNYAGK